MKIIFLDTETTDLADNARLVQLAYKVRDDGKNIEELNEIFNPEVSISCEAMSVHHITNKMVQNKSTFLASGLKEKIQEILDNNVLIAHNALYDIKILENEGLKVDHDRYIDTCRVAQHLIDSSSYKLQYLRYFLNLDLGEKEINPHDAFSDILVLEVLFDNLVQILKEKYNLQNDEEIISRMILLSKTPVLVKNLNFGKYKGLSFEEVFNNDRPYLEWLFNSENSKNKSEQNENLIFTLKKYLNLI
ncbi:MAG: 3'-5' exonuclease [Patescibacteria group bacterium]